MTFFLFTVGAFGVWRVTHLLYAEDGPWDLIFRLRRRAGQGFFGGLLDCFYCLSIWTAIPFALVIGDSWRLRVLLWPALSAVAIIIHRAFFKDARNLPVNYIEDEEEQTDVVLRPEQKSTSPSDTHAHF
jgi:hypothetical protein